MDSPLELTKAALRREMRDRMGRLDPKLRKSASALARSRIAGSEIWTSAQSILFYAPMPEELDIWPLAEAALAAGKIVAFPRFDTQKSHYAACRVTDIAGEFRAGQFGIREPADHCETLPLHRLDLIFVPGLAFDGNGRRLGRGKGFYDRLLAEFQGVTCGAAFDEQLAGQLPVGDHDVAVNWILTPARLIQATRGERG